MNKDKNVELELNDEQIARSDEIYNAVYQCILVLAEKSEDELPWNMEIIGSVTDAAKHILWTNDKIRVRHPGILTDSDGNQSYVEYNYPEE